MPLSPDDQGRVYTDAFQRMAKQMFGEASFAYADLKANFDVAQANIGVLQDELKTAQDQVGTLTSDRDRLKALWEASTEGKDAALQALAAAKPA